MGRGRFVNQKLGKNVSRKFRLLKSELSGHPKRNTLARVPNLALPKKGTSRDKA
jgi:hypothetical protein